MLSSDNNKNKSPDKPYNQTIPKSMQDSGVNPESGCEMTNASVGEMGFDEAMKTLGSESTIPQAG